jgi:periplasmic protein TonB
LNGKQVYRIVEQMPHYPGGSDEMMKYLARNIKFAHKEEEVLSGCVYLTFIIDATGRVSSACVCQRSAIASLTPMEQGALRAVMQFPQWITGKQNGKNVAVREILRMCF